VLSPAYRSGSPERFDPENVGRNRGSIAPNNIDRISSVSISAPDAQLTTGAAGSAKFEAIRRSSATSVT